MAKIFFLSECGKGQLMAKNLLTYAYGHQYYNCLPVDDTTAMKSTAVMPGANEADNGMYISVIPNPASTWVSFDYQLAEAKTALLEITDTQGRLIHRIELRSKQGQYVWDTRQINTGLYYYTLKTSHASKTGKLVVER